MTKKLTGGCFCGDIRYEVVGEPALQLLCYCADCLSITGTDGYAGFMVKTEDFSLKQGAPSVHEKPSRAGRSVWRHFCGNCGTNLWGHTEFGLTSVSAGTLDEPNRFKPTRKAFAHDAPDWARIPPDLDDI